MTVIEHGLRVAGVERPVGLLDAYAASHHVLGGTVEYQRLRRQGRSPVLAEHPDLTVWITGRCRSGSLTCRARRRCGRWSPTR